MSFIADLPKHIVEITDSIDTSIVQYSYDALGRRIQKDDKIAGQKTRYYHNHNWQVLTETDENDNTLRWFVYGNYIDEPLMMHAEDIRAADRGDYYYVQDELFNVRASVCF